MTDERGFRFCRVRHICLPPACPPARFVGRESPLFDPRAKSRCRPALAHPRPIGENLSHERNEPEIDGGGGGLLLDLARTRASGGATGELSYHTPLANLLNAVGGALKPKAFCVPELADQGAGHPDFGLYAAKQVQRGRPREGQTPEHGVVEVKSADDDTWLTAEGEQVSRYWNRYRLVLVTNTRDFALVGERAGRPIMLERFRLAESKEDFERRLNTPRSFARSMGAGLAEYLTRALSHQAAIAEPKDLAWLLASYARDGLSRVERIDLRGDAMTGIAGIRSSEQKRIALRRGVELPCEREVRMCPLALLRLGSSSRNDFIRDPATLHLDLGIRRNDAIVEQSLILQSGLTLKG